MRNQILQSCVRVAHHCASDRFEHVLVTLTRTRYGERSNIGANRVPDAERRTRREGIC